MKKHTEARLGDAIVDNLNNVSEFSLPPSYVEAMYAPEMFGETLNARVKVEALQ